MSKPKIIEHKFRVIEGDTKILSRAEVLLEEAKKMPRYQVSDLKVEESDLYKIYFHIMPFDDIWAVLKPEQMYIMWNETALVHLKIEPPEFVFEYSRYNDGVQNKQEVLEYIKRVQTHEPTNHGLLSDLPNDWVEWRNLILEKYKKKLGLTEQEVYKHVLTDKLVKKCNPDQVTFVESNGYWLILKWYSHNYQKIIA